MNLTKNIDKAGAVGLFITAVLSPCCFPLFAGVAAALGFGSAEIFGGVTMYVFQAMVLISIIGLSISYRTHRYVYPLLIAVPGALLIFYGCYFNQSSNWVYFLYAGMFGILAATGLNYFINHRHKIACATCKVIDGKTLELESTITCPRCGYKKKETMPTDTCQFFYECEKCKAVLKPKEGDCCVYCSYGTVKCPSIQAKENCC